MIRFIDEDFSRYNEVEALCRNDPFGVRILSYMETYDRSLSFTDFWYQEDKKGNISAVISRFQDRYTVCAGKPGKNSEMLELLEFIKFRSPSSVMFDSGLSIKFNEYKRIITGDVLTFKISAARFKDIKDDIFCTPGIEEYYDVLLMNRSENFIVPDYKNFLSDVTYRKNRDKTAVFGIKNDDSLAGVCMTVAECKNAVIMGAVATVPEYQGMGYASKLVNRAASLLILENKDVYIFSIEEKNTRLYKKIGFTGKCRFIEYIFR